MWSDIFKGFMSLRCCYIKDKKNALSTGRDPLAKAYLVENHILSRKMITILNRPVDHLIFLFFKTKFHLHSPGTYQFAKFYRSCFLNISAICPLLTKELREYSGGLEVRALALPLTS